VSEMRTCLACGHEGHDVRMRVVAYDDPRPVTVHIPVSHREDAIEEPREVPGVWGAETRCIDRAACAERVLLLLPTTPRQEPPGEPVPAPQPAAAPEPTTGDGGPEAWL
jgi:hypothetical protein